MVHLSAEEARKAYIDKMGKPLGEQFAELWQELAYLHLTWGVHVQLYGTKPERIDLLNRAAGGFFRIVQDTLWHNTMLHISRLTDPPQSGKGKNLTIRNFPRLIADVEFRREIEDLIADAVSATVFCRDWRNRHIAHRDLSLALDEQPVEPLAPASRKLVKEALEAIVKVLNAIEGRYTDAETYYAGASTGDDAVALLQILHRGVQVEERWRERLMSGHFGDDGLPPDL